MMTLGICMGIICQGLIVTKNSYPVGGMFRLSDHCVYVIKSLAMRRF